MTLYPAIDLKDGHCVRLRQGRMEDATVFTADVAEQAKQFVAAGCSWLHLVDLNGAFAGEPINREAVHLIRQAVGVNIQLGGGIRNLDTIQMWLATGIQRVILGTAAVKNPALVREACREFAGKIAVGIDAKDGMVAVDGWAEASNITALELAKRFEDAGVTAIIHTDIARDGEMQGANLEASVALAQAVSIPVIVSGGVASLQNLRDIRAQKKQGISGVIVGRALYEGMDITAAREIIEG
jgi:phosphoribosylformimino-5-aminoimidazole carboxamide ribotide isomerase